MKQRFLIGTLTVFACIGFFTSCGTEELFYDEQSESLNIEEQYEAACKKWATINSEELEKISNYQSRNNPDHILPANDIVGFLMSLSDENFTIIYNEYVDEEQMCQRAEETELKIDTLIDVTSATEVQQLYNYINDYISIGGHSVDYVEQHSSPIESPVIKYLTINSSAYYDQITSIETAEFFASSPDLEMSARRLCILKCAFDCGGIAITSALEDIIFGPGDEAFFIYDCTHDLADILMAIDDLRDCLRRASSGTPFNPNDSEDDIE